MAFFNVFTSHCKCKSYAHQRETKNYIYIYMKKALEYALSLDAVNRPAESNEFSVLVYTIYFQYLHGQDNRSR